MAEPTRSTPVKARRVAGLHPTGLAVAVVGLCLSVAAYFVAYRETSNNEQERVQEVADQVADQVAEALSDIGALTSGIEGTLIATQEANQEDLERLMSLQVGRSALITSATLLKAQEGSNLDRFGRAGNSDLLDFEDLLANDPDLLAERISMLAAVPDGSLRLIGRTTVDGEVRVAVANAFVTQPSDEALPPEQWVVEVELGLSDELLESLSAPFPGQPDVEVYVGDEVDPDELVIDTDPSSDGNPVTQRAISVSDANAVVGVTPTTGVLGDQEQALALFVFLAGLTLTAAITPLVGRLSSRREEVRMLSAQRDELDEALEVSKQIERELRASEQRFRSVLHSSPDVVLWIDPGTATLQILNRSDLFGHDPQAVQTVDEMLALTHPDDLDRATEGLELLRSTETGTVTEFECRIRRSDDAWEWLRVRGGRVQRDDGGSGPVLAVLTVISDQKREEMRRAELEAQLVQSQRLEAVGQLAGGVAHDFNNILAAIVSGAELVLDEVEGQPKEDVEEIRRTARRGSDLARQLLVFSRRDRGSAPEVVNLNAVIDDVQTMLRRTLDESIEMRCELVDDAHKVHIDPTQIERILMNLTINARDAMPSGGAITIRTANRDLDADDVATRTGLTPGQYVELTVADTGSGMPEEVRRHAFEPFFSTKEIGKGTGLGLATVYGIVQGAQGHIEIDSAPGEGTTFSILLPRTRLQDRLVEDTDAPDAPTVLGGTERILLVEDEDGVREAARRLLEKRGYEVIPAADGASAVIGAGSATFDLLLTDVLMPGGMNGREVAREVRRMKPDVAVLYMTGHSDDVLENIGIDDDAGEALILRKPFTEEELMRAVRRALVPATEPAT